MGSAKSELQGPCTLGWIGMGCSMHVVSWDTAGLPTPQPSDDPSEPLLAAEVRKAVNREDKGAHSGAECEAWEGRSRLFLNKWHVLSYIHIPNRKWCLLRTFCYKKSKPACANHFPSTSTNSWLTLVHLSHPRSSSCYFEAQLRHIISTVIISVCISKR